MTDRPPRLLAAGALAVSLAVSLAGCSSSADESKGPSPTPSATSPSSDPEQQRVRAATATLTDFFSVYSPVGQGQSFTRGEATCISRHVVRDPGVERLQRAGVLDEDMQYVAKGRPRLSRGDAGAVTRAVFACSDAEEVARRQAIQRLGATASQKACATKALSDELIGRLFVRSMLGQSLDPAVADVAQAFAPCRAS